jgi:hypothetical protein
MMVMSEYGCGLFGGLLRIVVIGAKISATSLVKDIFRCVACGAMALLHYWILRLAVYHLRIVGRS